MRQLFWSIAYRANFPADIVVTSHRSAGHGPKSAAGGVDGTLLIDATRKHDMPPLALPAERDMTRVKEIWEELQLPSLSPQSPWQGYTMGDWDGLRRQRDRRRLGGQRRTDLAAPQGRHEAGDAGQKYRRQIGSGNRRL